MPRPTSNESQLKSASKKVPGSQLRREAMTMRARPSTAVAAPPIPKSGEVPLPGGLVGDTGRDPLNRPAASRIKPQLIIKKATIATIHWD